MYVCLCVLLSVCSLLRYRLNVFLPPLPEVGCPIFLEIRNLWGKVMERSCLRLEHCCLEVVLNCQTKNKTKKFWLIFPYKTRWKPHFLMDWRPLVEGRIANLAYFYMFLSFCVLDDFFLFFKTIWVFGYSWSTRKTRFPMD